MHRASLGSIAVASLLDEKISACIEESGLNMIHFRERPRLVRQLCDVKRFLAAEICLPTPIHSMDDGKTPTVYVPGQIIATCGL